MGRPASAQDVADEADAPELDTLVAPIALFPDPLLAAVLQASVVPLDVVQAARFLDDYAKDPTQTPDADWDPAVLGLLAFPTVLKGMNEHLDWVQEMGDAVTQRLPDVQDSIQQVRAEFYAGGVLKSDDKQTVEVDSEIIRITPVDPNQIFVPVYDPQELVARGRGEQQRRPHHRAHRIGSVAGAGGTACGRARGQRASAGTGRRHAARRAKPGAGRTGEPPPPPPAEAAATAAPVEQAAPAPAA